MVKALLVKTRSMFLVMALALVLAGGGAVFAKEADARQSEGPCPAGRHCGSAEDGGGTGGLGTYPWYPTGTGGYWWSP